MKDKKRKPWPNHWIEWLGITAIAFAIIIILGIVYYESRYDFVCQDTKEVQEWMITCVATRSDNFLGTPPYEGCSRDRQRLFCKRIKKAE